MSHLSDSRRLKVCCTLAVTLEMTNLSTQIELWNFCTLEVYSLALILSIMSHLNDSRRLKVCCTLVVTLEVTSLGTQLKLWNFCTLEVYSLALILSIMSHLSDSRRLTACCTLVVTLEVTYRGTLLKCWGKTFQKFCPCPEAAPWRWILLDSSLSVSVDGRLPSGITALGWHNHCQRQKLSDCLDQHPQPER